MSAPQQETWDGDGCVQIHDHSGQKEADDALQRVRLGRIFLQQLKLRHPIQVEKHNLLKINKHSLY